MRREKRKSPSEEYFEGQISASECIKKMEGSREADRRRRAIEERVHKLSEKVRCSCRFD